MSDGIVYSAGWTLDEVQWSKFDPSKVDADILQAMKAASLVEYNAPDYVDYLMRVFKDSGSEILGNIQHWGVEETQHGLALGRWCELADKSFDFKTAFARFRKGYQPPHFVNDDANSIRGSRRGEMVARCVVESGTSSFYTAIREAAEEPVLREVAGRIAADELRHYKLFYETLDVQDEPDLPFWRKLIVALTRVNESDDDELAYAFYAANVPADQPYVRKDCAKAYYAKSLTLYRKHHVRKLVQMIAKAIGADPNGRLTQAAGAVAWRALRLKAGIGKSSKVGAAA